MDKIRIGKPYFDYNELAGINDVLESGCWAGTCSTVELFEKKFANTVGAKYAVACSSATAGLHVALIACGIGNGDEVIVGDYSFPASAFAVAHALATALFADIRMDTYCIDCDDIEKLVGFETDKRNILLRGGIKAIMPVAQFSMPCDRKEIVEIADKYNLRIVWDSATGLGSEYKGNKIGAFRDCEVFSTFPTKIISTGEGGVITTNDKEIADLAKSVVDFGKVKTKEGVNFDKLGYNYRLSAIHAAIGIAQLDKLPDFLKHRRELAKYYKQRINEEVESLYWLRPQLEPSDRKSAWQRFVCIASHKNIPTLRDEVMAYLNANGVECVKGNYALHQIDYFRNLYLSKQECVKSAFVYRHSLALPLHYTLSKKRADYVIEKLIEFRKNHDRL